MPIEQVSELIDADTAIVIVVAENDKHRSYSPQLRQETNEMREPTPNIQQIPRDKDPVRSRPFHGPHDLIMAREIAIQMEVAQLHGPSSGHDRMRAGDVRHHQSREAELNMRDEIEEEVKRTAQPVPDPNPRPFLPTDNPGDHFMSLSRLALSRDVNR